jgi:Bacterial virulence factor lipase N-terminal
MRRRAHDLIPIAVVEFILAAPAAGGLRSESTRRTLSLLARFSAIACLLLVAAPSVPAAVVKGVEPRFDLAGPAGGPFPSDRFTVPDASQNTGLRVELPKPDCAARPSDCDDLDVVNELDGFNLQPRLSLPFDGAIDVASVTSDSVFLVSLGSTLPGGDPGGRVVGINQVVWDTFTNTLHVESDELLDQHTRYVLVVTKKVLDAGGKEVKAAKAFLDFVDESNSASTGDPALDAYRAQLRDALAQIDAAGVVPRGQVVAASVFTTQSVTAVLEKIRDQIKATTPPPADFLLGPGGSRTVFPRSAVTRFVFNQQRSADPTKPLTNAPLPLSVLDVVPGAVGTIAFGRYTSPDYRVHPGEFIPLVGTRSGTPVVQGTSDITFVLVLPSSPEPANGYPIAIFGHGGTSDKTASSLVAAKLAEQGIATIGIDAPGNGFGPLSRYTLTFTDSTSVTIPAGGRGIDQNGDGQIAQVEGFGPAPPRTIQGGRDGLRQGAADTMQLVREIEMGMDVDEDSAPDLDPSRIYYVGTSRGGDQGTLLLAVVPSVRAAVLNVPTGSVELNRLSAERDGGFLQSRVPSLINSPGITSLDGLSTNPLHFNENMPLRNRTPLSVELQDGTSQVIRSPVTNTVAGAAEIQHVIENREWASQSGSSGAYAPYIRRGPLDAVHAKPVIIQFANGDRVNPNPSTTALLRAGDLADRATFVRTNLIFPDGNPPVFPGNPNLYPHGFMAQAIVPGLPPNVRGIAIKAQHQIASFFASDGTEVIDPDNVAPVLPEPIFEVPIVPPLPEALNYFP